MKKTVYAAVILSFFIVSFSGVSAQEIDKQPEERKIENKADDPKKDLSAPEGIWENKGLFHLDLAFGAGFSLLTSNTYVPQPVIGLVFALLSFRVDATIDFSFALNKNMNIGYEQGISFMTFEFLRSSGTSTAVNLTNLDLKFRLFYRFAVKNFFIQVYGGFFLPVLAGISSSDGSVNTAEIAADNFMAIETGLRLGMSNFFLDAAYLFTKNSGWQQVRVSMGFHFRAL